MNNNDKISNATYNKMAKLETIISVILYFYKVMLNVSK